jgi:O-methyltransferase domain
VVDQPKPDFEAMLQLTRLGDFATPIAIRTVSDLGVADQLVDGPRSAEEIAEAVGAHAPSLYRVLRALACQGIFVETEKGRFGLTPMADLLRADHPYSLRHHYQMMVPDLQAWTTFDHSVRTAGNSFEHVHGQRYWDYVATHPEYKKQFDATIWTMTEHELRVVVPGYRWDGVDTLVDIGGGTGQMLAGILGANPAMSGVLFDLPHVAPGSLPVLEAAGVADRCEIVGGDFFVSVPEGGDAYLLKRVLYDFDDDQSVAILSNVRKAMKPDSRALTLDAIVRSDNRFDVGKLHDLFVLAMGVGRCRTRQEMTDLFDAAGLRLTRVIPTGIFPLVEARPV